MENLEDNNKSENLDENMLLNETNKIKINEPLIFNKSILKTNTERNGSSVQGMDNLYTMRRLKSLEGTRIQQLKLNQYLIEDKKLLNISITTNQLSNFMSGDLEVIEVYNEIFIKVIENWFSINDINKSDKKNIILKNKLIKLKSPVLNLRSLAIEIEISMIMAGESSFFIFTRCSDNLTNECLVFFITKELESSRKFINFAILEDNNENLHMNLKVLKKQEIPKQENYDNSLDITEVKLTFIDNGDNKCFVLIHNESTKKPFFFVADFFYPNSESSNVMLGAKGDLISLTTFSIKQIERNAKISLTVDYNKNIQKCNCCIVF